MKSEENQEIKQKEIKPNHCKNYTAMQNTEG